MSQFIYRVKTTRFPTKVEPTPTPPKRQAPLKNKPEALQTPTQPPKEERADKPAKPKGLSYKTATWLVTNNVTRSPRLVVAHGAIGQKGFTSSTWDRKFTASNMVIWKRSKTNPFEPVEKNSSKSPKSGWRFPL